MTAAGDEDARTLLIPGQCDIRNYGALTATSSQGFGNGTRTNTGTETEAEHQDGVESVVAVSRTWSSWGLAIAYMRWVNVDQGFETTGHLVDSR